MPPFDTGCDCHPQSNPDLLEAIDSVQKVLRDSKPADSQPMLSVFWRELVRNTADALFTRPDWSEQLTDSMESWIAFTDEVGYLS